MIITKSLRIYNYLHVSFILVQVCGKIPGQKGGTKGLWRGKGGGGGPCWILIKAVITRRR